jgi:hypothetical protein
MLPLASTKTNHTHHPPGRPWALPPLLPPPHTPHANSPQPLTSAQRHPPPLITTPPPSGRPWALPPGYTGALVTAPGGTTDLQERPWSVAATFDALAYWVHDAAPTATDGPARALTWLALAQQVGVGGRGRARVCVWVGGWVDEGSTLWWWWCPRVG